MVRVAEYKKLKVAFSVCCEFLIYLFFLNYQLFDLDGDGYVSVEEVQFIMKTFGKPLKTEAANEMVKELDIDGDGKLNFSG
jgi:Ca2+-binding EF-hand superfamily protein